VGKQYVTLLAEVKCGTLLLCIYSQDFLKMNSIIVRPHA
jgi:hypothetical protein